MFIVEILQMMFKYVAFENAILSFPKKIISILEEKEFLSPL